MSGETFKKELLHPGRKEIPKFEKNTKVMFHFRTFKPKLDEDSHIINPEPGDVIDDSRTMGIGPFELLIGREFKLDIWDEMVRTMHLDEVARFVCPFRRILEYPRVSKALRDIALEKAGKNVPHRDHHCGFAAMQGTGHADLDRIMEERSPLCFEIELIKVEQPGQYKQEHWAMTDKEKETALPLLKEQGNTLYMERNFSQAAEKYFEALSYLEEQLIKEKPQSDSWYIIARQKIPFLLNYSQCKLVLEDYAEVIRHTTSVLEIDSDNIKALYRRGMAHSARWDVEEAQEDLRRVAQLDTSLVKTVNKELRSLAQRVKEKDAAEREKLKGKMFT